MDLRRRPSRIMAAPPIADLSVKPPFFPHPRVVPDRRPAALPAALAFLTVHGVSPAVLLAAAAEARRHAIAPEAAALASGTIRERYYYQCLADHLGAVFIDGEVALAAGTRYPHAVHAGLAPLDGGDGVRWLAAPRGQLLTHLLARARGGERLGAGLAITTPSHLSSLVRAAATASILREASLGLANLDPSLSAKERPSHSQCTSAMAVAAAATLAFGLAPAFTLALVSLSVTCFFLASIWLRLFAGAASTACGQEPFRVRVEDRRLPVYSIVVALHREARVVPQLIAALAAIDYPVLCSKLTLRDMARPSAV
jgi:glycosyltransferase XagB